MSKCIKLLALAGVAAAISACTPKPQEEEVVVVTPPPVTSEPVFHGKYK